MKSPRKSDPPCRISSSFLWLSAKLNCIFWQWRNLTFTFMKVTHRKSNIYQSWWKSQKSVFHIWLSTKQNSISKVWGNLLTYMKVAIAKPKFITESVVFHATFKKAELYFLIWRRNQLTLMKVTKWQKCSSSLN